ncbi:retrovirus-related pol polyprotein from transposon TNT 1-94 [Tanacetum coccineum]
MGKFRACMLLVMAQKDNISEAICSGPNWLFDINALTRTMNYEPIVAGTQSNGFVDPKSSHDDESKPSSDVEKKVDKIQEKKVNANMNNLDTTIQVSPNLTTRIHKDHPLDQVIGDLQSATQTRKMSKNLKEHGFAMQNKKDDRGIVIRNETRLIAQWYTQEEGINYDEVFAPVARIEAIKLFLAYSTARGSYYWYWKYKVNAAEGINVASKEVSTAELVSTAYVIYGLEGMFSFDVNASL